MKKFSAILLAVVLLLTFTSSSAFAAGTTTLTVTTPQGGWNNPTSYYTNGQFLLQWDQYNTDPSVTFDYYNIWIFRASDHTLVYNSGKTPQSDPTSNSGFKIINGLPMNEKLYMYMAVYTSDGGYTLNDGGNVKAFILYP